MFRQVRQINAKKMKMDKAQMNLWPMIPQLIFTIFISMLIGFLLFLLIDRIFDAKNVVTPFGILFGLIVGWMAAFRQYKNANTSEKHNPEEDFKQDE